MIFLPKMNFRQVIENATAFLLFVVPMIAIAQDVGPQTSGATGAIQSDDDGGGLLAPSVAHIPIIQVKNMAKRPSLVPVFKAVAYSNMSEAHAELLVEYNMQGDITDVEFLKSTRNASINKAILEWVKKVKLVPGEAGKGRLLFDMETH